MLETCRLDLGNAAAQLVTFRAWLARHDYFVERDVVRELRARRDLCLLINLAVGRGMPDRVKHEFAIQGALKSDLVVGSSSRAHFVLVEFEGGEKTSLFSRGTKQLRGWGAQLQHGFSQVSDWTWAKNDNQKSDLYRNAFGAQHMSETYVVVCGRSSTIDETEKSRLHWRSKNTMIASSHIHFWTYDDLCEQVEAALDIYKDIQSSGAAFGGP